MIQQQEISQVTLPTAVTDAIRDMLPAQVGKTLREELAKGEAAVGELADLKAEMQKIEARLDEAGDLESKRRSLEQREGELATAEEQAAEALQKQVEFRLETQLEAEKRVSAKLENALAGLVRNTEWRENVFNSFNGPYTMTDGIGANANDGSNKTTTAE